MKYKLNDEQFWHCLNLANGTYSKSCEMAKLIYGVSITPPSIRQRAMANPEMLKRIRDITINVAENGLKKLMKGAKNEMVKLNAIKYFLSNQGKHAGWTERKEVDLNAALDLNMRIEFVDAPTDKTLIIEGDRKELVDAVVVENG